MAQVLLLSQAECQQDPNCWNGEPNQWLKVNPPNVLILPQLIPPDSPLVPHPQPNRVLKYTWNLDTCSPGGGVGSQCCLVHDSVSGWWVQFTNSCDPGCTPDLAAQGICSPSGCLEGRLLCGAHIGVDGQLYFEQGEINAQLPSWAGSNPVWDKFLLACCPPVEVPTNLLKPNGGGPTCPPPGRIQLVNGVPVCATDPPLPSPIPSPIPFSPVALSLGSRTVLSESYSEIRQKIVIGFSMLDPTKRRGVPFVFAKRCACNDKEDFIEDVI